MSLSCFCPILNLQGFKRNNPAHSDFANSLGWPDGSHTQEYREW